MVGKLLTIIGVFQAILTGSAPAFAQGAQSDGRGSTQAVARATIVRPALLRVSGQVVDFDAASTTDGPIQSKRLVRSCVAGETSQCTLIVFDLL